MVLRIALAFVLALAVWLPCRVARADSTPAATADKADVVLKQLMQQAPDRAIPKDLLRHAYAIAVIPDVIKLGLVLGGRHGEGLISVKRANGQWSAPAFITLSGASVGFQAGVSSTDVVLVFGSKRGVDTLVNGKLTLGVDAHAAAGPVGRNVSAATDVALQSAVYSYSRSRGLFAGVALDGAVLRIDDKANAALYGSERTAQQVFASDTNSLPGPLARFHDQLLQYTGQ